MDKEKRVYDSKKGFTKSAEVIDLLKKSLGLDDKILAISKIWDQELGPAAKYLELEGFNKNNLIISAANSSQFHEVMIRKRELISKINQYFGNQKVVKDIKIKLKA